MPDSVALIRPNLSILVQPGNWINFAASDVADFADDLDSTIGSACASYGTNVTSAIYMGLQDVALPAGAIVTAIYPIVRTRVSASWQSPAIFSFVTYLEGVPPAPNEYGPWNSGKTVYGNSWQNVGGLVWWNKSDGKKFTQEEVNRMIFYLAHHNDKLQEVAAVYVYVYYNVRPTVVVTDPVEGSNLTLTNAPLIKWTYTDPDGDANHNSRVKIFSAAQYGAVGFDPETSVATQDSGDLGVGLVQWQSAALGDNGTYRAYVKVKDHLQWSLWDYNQFTVNIVPPGSPGSQQPGAPVLTATEEINSARVRLNVAEGTSPTADSFVIERSEDGGATWEEMRGSPIPHVNAIPAVTADFETDTSGWPNVGNMAATYPQTTVAAVFSGSKSMIVKALAAGDVHVETNPNRWPVTPGTALRARAYSRPVATARTFRIQIRWFNAAGTWFASSDTTGTLQVLGEFREDISDGVAPADAVSYDLRVTWIGCAIDEEHYLDTISVKPQTLPALYDYNVPRRATSGQIKYRAKATRMSGSSPVDSVWSALVTGVLGSDGYNWLKSPTDPNLNMRVVFSFGQGQQLETTAKEEQTAYLPKGRSAYVVFGSHTEGEEFDLPLLFMTDAAYQSFETLRKRRETLMLQTVYGETALEQFWIKLGPDRANKRVNTYKQESNQMRKVEIKAKIVSEPGSTTKTTIVTGAVDGEWYSLPLTAGNTAEPSNPPMYMKDSRGYVRLKGRINGVALNEWVATLPAGYRPDSNIYVSWTVPSVLNRMGVVSALGGISVGSIAAAYPASPNDFMLLDRIVFLAVN